MNENRYHRQMLLPEIGPQGQAALARSCVLIVGCGALGCSVADQLARAGVGTLRLVDRDLVEWTNLQRQTLFSESDARDALPKAVAAAGRLSAVNSHISLEPVIADIHSQNVEAIAGLHDSSQPVTKQKWSRCDLIVDGTDNVATRYLLNDVAIKHRVPWVHGACVGVSGRVLAVRPGVTGCLRCVYPNPPRANELPTCDTAGVLGAAAAVVGALQATAAIQMLIAMRMVGPPNPAGEDAGMGLLAIDVWTGTFRRIQAAAIPQSDCKCCGERQFDYLDHQTGDQSASLCGRQAVQISPRNRAEIDLAEISRRFTGLGEVHQNRFFARCRLRDEPGVVLTLFADGRLIVLGTTDLIRAKSLYARYIGS